MTGVAGRQEHRADSTHYRLPRQPVAGRRPGRGCARSHGSAM